MLCWCQLQDPCVAQEEAHTLNVLVWVGSAATPDPKEDVETRCWLSAAANASAVAVVPEGSDPDEVLPVVLRNRQVVRWGGSAEMAALDVLAAAEVTTAERRIFISYSHVDGMELAHAVFRALSEARYSVFLDAFALAPGSDFAERIEHELLEKAFLILIETPKAIASDWVTREIGFARQHRLGLAAVLPDPTGPRLEGIGRSRRWLLPAGGLNTSRAAGSSLAPAHAEGLRAFVGRLHGEAMLRRRRVLDVGLRAALRRAGVSASDVTAMAGGLRVTGRTNKWAVSLRPRPASLIDMHTAARQWPSEYRGVMVSATPRGWPEREALGWLADESGISHWDEGRLLSLARSLA